ncbi:phage tail tape measure protein [Vreelandella alkaliphila]|uniref:Phage tail tape measure protein n=1 Tax=Vreelandella alkaliphila TaxID=272774 RepID=A0A7C9JT32_9GAMM|nr:phage tail tape measure protein [Halomonas alkaliphila]NDL70503.1 phage tail tape measure protein [Halomonas alkaliphila]
MASSLRELIVRVSADSSVYQREMARASRMGSDYYKTMESGARRQDAAIRSNQTNLRALNAQMLEIRQTALRTTGVLAGAFAAGSLIQTADAYGQMASRIRLAIDSEREYAQVQERLQQISRVTYKSLMDNSELFVNSVGPLRELGFATEDVLDVTEALSAGLVISGANAQATTSLIDQFSKGMIAGKLQGDAFNAVIQNAPRLQQALAEGLGVTNRRLAEMATAGELTADVVMGALQRSLGAMRQELEEMPTSVEDATQVLKDSFMAYIGQANDAHGTTATLAGGIELLADNIENVVAVAGVFAAMGLGRYMGALAVNAGAAAAEFVKNSQAQIAYAAAQQQATAATARQAAAESVAAKRELGRAMAAEKAARGTDQHAAALTRLGLARTAATSASAQHTVATNAEAVAQSRLAAATSLASRAKAAALALLPGPAGLITLAAGAAASFLLFRDRTDEAAASLLDIEQPMDTLIQQFRELTVENQKAALIRWGDKQAEEAEKARKAMEGIRQGLLGEAFADMDGATARGFFDELTSMFADVESGARSMDSVLTEVQERIGIDDRIMREYRLLAAEFSDGTINAQEFGDRINTLNGLLDETAGAAGRAGRGVENGAPSEQTLQAWQRYNDQLRDQIANLRDPSALGQASRRLDAMGPEVSDVMRGYTLWLSATAEQEQANADARKKAADAARDAAREGQRNAERIVQAYQQQAEALQRQIALHGDNSRAAALAYDLSSGSLRELLPQQQAHIRQLSEELGVKEKLFKQAQEAQELARFEAAERARLAARAQDMEIDIIAVGRSDQAIEVMREIATVRQRYADEMRELHQRQEDDATRISEAAYEERRALLMRLMDEEVGLVETAAARKRAAEENWRNGANRGLEAYMDQARNVAAQSERAMVNGLNRTEDELVNFAKTAKFNFTDLADSIISDLIRIAIRQAALGIFGMVSLPFGGGGAVAGGFMSQMFAEGGYTGPGGKYEPAGIVHRGEVVWSQEDVARAGGLSVVEALRKGFSGYSNGGAVGVSMPSPSLGSNRRGEVIINQIEDKRRAGQVQESTGPDGERVIDMWVASVMGEDKAHKALVSKYGLNTRAT